MLYNCTVTFGLMYCDLWISKSKKEYFPQKQYEEIRYMPICFCEKLHKRQTYLMRDVIGDHNNFTTLWILWSFEVNFPGYHSMIIVSRITCALSHFFTVLIQDQFLKIVKNTLKMSNIRHI